MIQLLLNVLIVCAAVLAIAFTVVICGAVAALTRIWKRL